MVDIIVVNWNGGDLLRNCITSILDNRNKAQLGSLIIIDNNSTDHSLELLPNEKKIKIIRNEENIGFAKACNQGFKAATAEYVLLLNPDTELFENTLANCIAFMEQHQDVDILGAQLLNEDHSISPSCARFPTPIALFRDALGLSKIAPGLFKPAILMTDWDHKESRFVDQVMGAFMFMKRDIFKTMGYFDEQFFVYFEELDFSLRLANAGGKSYYHTGIKAIHIGKGTTESVKAFRLFLNLRSRLLFAKKHFSSTGYYMVYVSTLTIEFFTRLVFMAIKGNVNDMKELVRTYKMLWQSRKNYTNNTIGGEEQNEASI